MSAHHFHDGIYHAANKSNAASGRSWHIPAPTSRFAFYAVTALQLIACALPVVLIWVVLS